MVYLKQGILVVWLPLNSTGFLILYYHEAKFKDDIL